MTTPDRLNRRLLGFVLHQPRRVLVLGVASGMAVADELVHRRQRAALRTLCTDEALRNRACELVLSAWMQAERVGDLDAEQFDALCDRIIAIAQAS